MNPSITEFDITPAMVSDAEQEKDRLEQVISDAQRKHGLILQFLRLAAAYSVSAEPQPEAKPKDGPAVETADTDAPEEIDPTNVMGALRRIANESPKPLQKKELKAALIAAGVDEERINGPYFYVAIARLKDKERISVLDDGRVWKALPKN
jgi:hypothetical protein